MFDLVVVTFVSLKTIRPEQTPSWSKTKVATIYEHCWRVVIHEDANLFVSCAIFEVVVVALVSLKIIRPEQTRTGAKQQSQQAMNNAIVSLSTRTPI